MAELLATYRLQLHAGFPLASARELIPYLHRLGITHIHCSPLLQARRGSTHGYDVTDPTRLNPELGTEEELAALVEELETRDMGIVLDIVPNHMAASSESPAWEDVLTHGPASRYARWFDVEWRAPERELRFRVLLPVLGDQRARVLQRGEIRLALEEGSLRVQYYDHSFPLDPGTLGVVLEPAIAECEEVLGLDATSCQALREVRARLRRLPRRTVRRPASITRRRQEGGAALARLRELCLTVPPVANAIAGAAEGINSEDGFERLRRLLDAQVYRLVYWRRAAREINYRRFFDINDLVGLHMEDPEVFDETHALVLEWRRRRWIHGFRIDHPDGLLDPLGYLRRLSAVASLPGEGPPPVYVEKILSPGERLRPEWPVAGTTGYDFLNQAESLYSDAAGYHAIEQEYRRIIRQPLEFPAIARLAKRRILESALSAGVQRLAQRLLRLSGPDRPLPTVSVHALALALVETIASLPVYRTYVDASTPEPGGDDRHLLEQALADARIRGRAASEALDLLATALLALDSPMRLPANEGLRLRFVQRFQQLSGPATAKGIEDTAFYSYAPLLSRNEVGGSPEVPLDLSVDELHANNGHRAQCWPHAVLAVTTHDTKRSADVRSRLDVLSQIPEEWAAAVDRWRGWCRAHKRDLRGQRAPDPNTVYQVLQAIVGIWPPGGGIPDRACLESLRQRMVEYAIKAAREAKLRTSWTDPDADFEAALQSYVEALFDPERSAEFLQDLSAFVRRIAPAGLWNSLSRTLLHLASPGVPDLYQGDELWNLALVDPDNRRPVDFERRALALTEVEKRFAGGADSRHQFIAEIMAEAEDGRVKLHLIRAVLHARRQYPDLFRSRNYEPLRAAGPAAGHVVGFGRWSGASRLIVLAPRLLALRVLDGQPPTAPAIWQDTVVRLPAGFPSQWRCALSGEAFQADSDGALPAPEAFRWLPVALLLS